jgi:formamidopyrimidine-DNA glycosylase
VPELPEAECARADIEAGALGRRVRTVDDSDPYVCRPHGPGEIAAALRGARFTTAGRRGKQIWAETDDGPVLGLHLGMTGRIRIDAPPDPFDRFSIEFSDGGRLALRDPRRLGRAVLGPDLSALGPDAAEVGREEFRDRVGRGTAPLKARIMDQATVAGVGNLMADEALWRARLSPLLIAGEATTEQLDALRREIRAVARRSIPRARVVGELLDERGPEAHCPRCGTPLSRGRVGGRTTYWCPRCQPAPPA